MAGKSPGFWFFTGDWLKDPELRFCSIFARGLLVDLLCILFEAKEIGHASKPDGTPRSNEEIVDAVNGSTREAKLAALAELEASGVLSRDIRGVLYSRRLARLGKLSETRSKSGSKGGSKTQAKFKQNANQTNNQNRGVSDSVSVSVSDTFNDIPKKEKSLIGFGEWYSLYPRKVAKGEAVKAYARALKRIGGDPAEAAAKLLEASKPRLLEIAKRDPQYQPNPATWLNGDGWQDEVKAINPTKPTGAGPGVNYDPAFDDEFMADLYTG
jgi:hypothetical protein